MAHVYRSHAADQARQNGWKSFRTLKNKDGTWECRQEQGDNPANEFAWANNEWCAWGEAAWVCTAGDRGPELVGVLVVKCKYDQLRHHGDVLPDRTVAKVWLRPHGHKAGYLVEPLDAERWSIFGAGPVANQYPVAEKPAPATNAGAPAAPKPAKASAAPRSTADSPTKRVWAVADAMPGATRAQIVAACVEQGINKSTAGTQYFHWNKARAAAPPE